jgi:enoyl-CoA hydratase/carnithine racemase
MSVATDTSVLYDVIGGVATVTLNRPEKRNALLPAMTDRYRALLAEADDDPAVRAIVITGAGRGFCAGADLTLLAAGPRHLREFLRGAPATAEAAMRARKPVVAAVHGAAVGLGFGLAVGADLRFAADDATFTTSFARLGLVADYHVAWVLQRLVGLSNAADLLLSGRAVDAAEAARIGLVQRVVPAGKVLAAAQAYAASLAENCSPASMAAMKAQLWADAESSRTAARAASVAGIDASVGGPDAPFAGSDAPFAGSDAPFAGPDLVEAMAARATPRPPVFPPLPPRA